MVDLMEYIKIQWADIHHTRNQEWKVLVIIIGVFYAFFNVNIQHVTLHIAISIVGLIACGIGIYMSIVHWLIFYGKMKAIAACEKEMGIHARFYMPPLPIQGLIVLVYFFVIAILSAWLAWLLDGRTSVSCVTFIVCIVVGFSICLLAKLKIEKTIEKLEPMIRIEEGEKSE